MSARPKLTSLWNSRVKFSRRSLPSTSARPLQVAPRGGSAVTVSHFAPGAGAPPPMLDGIGPSTAPIAPRRRHFARRRIFQAVAQRTFSENPADSSKFSLNSHFSDGRMDASIESFSLNPHLLDVGGLGLLGSRWRRSRQAPAFRTPGLFTRKLT